MNSLPRAGEAGQPAAQPVHETAARQVVQILQLGNGQQHADDHANHRGDYREQQGHFQSIQQVLIAIVLNDGQENRIGKGLDDVLKSIHYGVQESASSQITDRQKSRPPKRPALFII